MTRTKEIEVWYQQYNRRDLTVAMSNARAADAHMNNGQFKPCAIDSTRGLYQDGQVHKLLEQQTNSANPIPAGGEISVRSERCVKIYPSRLCEVVQQVEDDDAFCRVYLSVYG